MVVRRPPAPVYGHAKARECATASGRQVGPRRHVHASPPNRGVVQVSPRGSRTSRSALPSKLKDSTVTLRERDTMEQRRMTVPELLEYLEEQIDG